MFRFLLALQFLTIVPLKIKEVSEKNIAGAMIYFPFVGLLLGIALLGISALLVTLNFSPLATNIILVIILIGVTGGMHLDGLSDTADAFLSVKSRDEMLEIMRDPHIGVMGTVSIVSIILLKIGLLASMAVPLKGAALLLACALSRWSSVLAMFLFSYARKDGKAKVFMQGMNLKIFALYSITVLVFAFAIWRLKGILALLIVAGCTYLGGKLSSRKIGGITGDTMGATIELTEIVTLLTVCIS